MLILLNKPFGVLCQFTDRDGRPTLADHVTQKNVYAAGRLDQDSEGLLLLTDDGALAHRITDPRHNEKTAYFKRIKDDLDNGGLEHLLHFLLTYDLSPFEVRQNVGQ